jgi:hypothetical protein
MVINPPTNRMNTGSVNVVMDKPTVNVPPEVSNMFRDKMESALFVGEEGTAAPFIKGPDLTIQYRFIQFSTGSRFKRWLGGGIGGFGEGSMTVEARFIDSTGKEISKIQSEGKIGAGVFGGSIDWATDKCVGEIVTYTKENFR